MRTHTPPGAAIIPCRNKSGEVVAEVLVDADDFEWLSSFKWSLSTAGYARRRAGNDEKLSTSARYPSMHRQIMGFPADRDVDHINGDRLDNRRCNLRVCTRQQNITNRTKPRADGLPRGVTFDEGRNKWRAQATVNYKHNFLGRYDTLDEAAQAVAAFRAQHMPFSADGHPARAA